jgi:peptidyl-prolyl cis-trans isomerase A (cyclophilin A)
MLLILVTIVAVSCGVPDGNEPATIAVVELDEEHPALHAPALAREQAPEKFEVRFETTKGDFVVAVNRVWAPRGADRFYNLVRVGYFTEVAFYRVLDGYISQFGTHGDPEVNRLWADSRIGDDPVQESNLRGMIAFAQEAPNSRTTQLYINLKDNQDLDDSGLAPFGQVVEGMPIVDSLFSDYGELHPKGDGPRPNLLQNLGNKYLKRQFSDLDYTLKATIEQAGTVEVAQPQNHESTKKSWSPG